MARATATESSAPPNESGATSRERSGRSAHAQPLQARRRSTVGGDGADRWAQRVADLPDLQAESVLLLRDDLHAAPDLGEQLDPVPLLELADRAGEDDVRHLRQVAERLVAVDPPLEVDLADGRQPVGLDDVDQQADLDRVAGEERHALEERAAAGVLAGERLDHARQLGEEEVDERARHELGDATAALRDELRALP